ncbi:Fc receptor-like protein 5 isoform X2 [Cavia porcellus]|uniref:Fc receptor-like protein 5 isoform X2 n=1 Tax=Cavia porcellus TaxID=10141 RepID=UPI002FDF0C52
MEPRTATSHRGFVSWQGFLLTASILTLWSPPTTAQMTIESVPFDAVEGADVLLLVHNLPKYISTYKWYKGETTATKSMIIQYSTIMKRHTTGDAHSNRETIYPNGSLLIKNVTREDTGFYTFSINRVLKPKTASGQFHVHKPVSRPSVQASNIPLTEDDPVVLTCLSNNTDISIRWIFNNQDLQLSERMNLSQNKSTLTIDPVKIEDAGEYQCEVSNPVSSNRSDTLWLPVFKPVSRPSVQASNTPLTEDDPVVLTCLSNNTDISIRWIFNNQDLQLSERMTLSENKSTLTINPVKIEDAGEYQCEVSNPVSSNRSDTLWLPVFKPVSRPSVQASNTPLTEDDPVVLTCLSNNTDISIRWIFNNQDLQLSERMTLSENKSTLTINPVKIEDAGEYQCEVSNPVSSNRSDTLWLPVFKPVSRPSVQASNTPLTEDDPVVLTCLSNNTDISIRWIFNNQDLQLSERMTLSENKSTLTINPVKIEDAGEYQCEVSNPVSSNRSDTLWLPVFKPVSRPSVQASNTPLTEDDPVVLTCLSNNTDISIRWIFNNQDLQLSERMTLSENKSTLTINPVKIEDAGEYQCEVSNPVSSNRSDTLWLPVFKPVSRPSVQASNTPLTEDDPVVLTCLSNNTDISIRWIFNNQDLQLSERMTLSENKSTLTINPVKIEDAGEYQCEVSNPVSSNRSDTLWLPVFKPVSRPSVQASNTPLTEDDPVVLTCLSNNTDISIRWIFNNQDLQLSERMTLSENKSTLTINPVKIEDAGEYQCEVSNPVSSNRSDTLWLPVFKPVSRPSVQASNTPLTEDDPVVLTCLSNNTDISIRWIFNNQDLQLSERMTLSENKSTLTINPVKIEDAGEYQCEVSNPVSSNRSDTLWLPVFKPVSRPSIQASNTTVTEDDSVFFTCLSMDPGISIRWIFNNQELHLSEGMNLSKNNSTLTIDPVKIEDAGEYQCEVSNPVNSNRSDTLWLGVFKPVSRPSVQASNTPLTEDDPVVLTCLSNNTDISIRWIFNNQDLQLSKGMNLSKNNSTLTIDPVKIEDAGEYQCEVSNPVSSNRSNTLWLPVFTPVRQPSIHASNNIVTEDDSVLLTCLSNDTGISIQWFFNKQDLQLSETMKLTENNSTLTIDPVKIEDAGKYHCEVSNPVSSNRSDPLQLNVFPFLPKPYITVNNSSPVEGEEAVALTCEPETQNTTYLWWINGQSLQDGDRLKLSEGNRTLTLLKVTRKDTGPYECETRNPATFNQSDPAFLNISYGPDDPVISPQESYFRAGTFLRLSCDADSNPPAQYSWLVNGSFLQPTQELFIPNISENDTGSYTCLVSNLASGLNKSSVKDITVTAPVRQPSIHISKTIVTEHDSVVLTCLSNDTGTSIQWIFKNQELKLSERKKLSEKNSTLTINPVKIEDAGEYQCEVSNPVSSNRSHLLRLNVSEDRTGLSVGVIVGIVIAAVAVVALISVLVYFLVFSGSGRTGPL